MSLQAADFDGIESYMSMIEGGREGELLKDMKQFFYYSQLRSQGDTMVSAWGDMHMAHYDY